MRVYEKPMVSLEEIMGRLEVVFIMFVFCPLTCRYHL